MRRAARTHGTQGDEHFAYNTAYDEKDKSKGIGLGVRSYPAAL